MSYEADIIERLEASAEEWEHSHRIDDETFRCDCGEPCKFSDAVPTWNSPYAPPCCRACYEKAREKAIANAGLGPDDFAT